MYGGDGRLEEELSVSSTFRSNLVYFGLDSFGESSDDSTNGFLDSSDDGDDRADCFDDSFDWFGESSVGFGESSDSFSESSLPSNSRSEFASVSSGIVSSFLPGSLACVEDFGLLVLDTFGSTTFGDDGGVLIGTVSFKVTNSGLLKGRHLGGSFGPAVFTSCKIFLT